MTSSHSTLGPTLFLAWQDKTTCRSTRRWYPVGRLRRLADGRYEFVYTEGFEHARTRAGMEPLIGLPDANQRYLSETLFPQFANRLMPASREEYSASIARLGLTDASDPLVVLARSGGRRETDAFQLVPSPTERVEGGVRHYEICAFTHGFRYMPHDEVGDACEKPLRLLWDFQNPQDPEAVMIRSEDNHLLGWVPRYYTADLLDLHVRGVELRAAVEHYNPPPEPAWVRLLVSIRASNLPEGFRALSAPEYTPLA